MNWEAAMRWARIRARDTGQKYRVRGYRAPWGWSYVVGQVDR